jgi:chemosensory pili system protein ChpA (sensor histidine kinase/response regulator)
MVVDDSITVRTVTKNFLERYRYKVVTAKDGVEALEKAQQLKPDLMLLDLEMPRADGFEVAQELRANPEFSKMPIIMITFCVGESQRAKAKELGIDYFIKKPYQEPELLDMIQNLLEKNKGL